MWLPCLLALSLSSLSVAVFQQSRCISTDLLGPCAVLPLGTQDRYMKETREVDVRFLVGCGAEHARLSVHDVSHMEISKNFIQTEIIGGFLRIGVPEPGTQLLNITLTHTSSGECLDWLTLCMDVTPDTWLHDFNAASDRWQHPQAGAAPSIELSAHVRQLTAAGLQQASVDDVIIKEQTFAADMQSDALPLRVLWVSEALPYSYHLCTSYKHSYISGAA